MEKVRGKTLREKADEKKTGKISALWGEQYRGKKNRDIKRIRWEGPESKKRTSLRALEKSN